MKQAKAQKKLSGSVAAYLTHKGVAHDVEPSLTFDMLATLSECCEPLALESEEARSAAYDRLKVLQTAASREQRPAANDPLGMEAESLINHEAVHAYALKHGRKYRDYVEHKVKHPRGKSPEELAECYMKLGEIDVALKGLKGEQALRVRQNALDQARYCLMAA